MNITSMMEFSPRFECKIILVKRTKKRNEFTYQKTNLKSQRNYLMKFDLRK